MIHPDLKRNPGLVERYEIQIFNSSYYWDEVNKFNAEHDAMEQNRMQSEIENSAKVKGI